MLELEKYFTQETNGTGAQKMIRNYSKAIIIMSLLFGFNLATGADAPGWVGPTKIETITVQPNGNIYIYLEASSVPDLGCSGSSGKHVQIDTSAPFYKEQFSLLMAAHLAARDVRIYVNYCGYYPYAQNSKLM